MSLRPSVNSLVNPKKTMKEKEEELQKTKSDLERTRKELAIQELKHKNEMETMKRQILDLMSGGWGGGSPRMHQLKRGDSLGAVRTQIEDLISQQEAASGRPPVHRANTLQHIPPEALGDSKGIYKGARSLGTPLTAQTGPTSRVQHQSGSGLEAAARAHAPQPKETYGPVTFRSPSGRDFFLPSNPATDIGEDETCPDSPGNLSTSSRARGTHSRNPSRATVQSPLGGERGNSNGTESPGASQAADLMGGLRISQGQADGLVVPSPPTKSPLRPIPGPELDQEVRRAAEAARREREAVLPKVASRGGGAAGPEPQAVPLGISPSPQPRPNVSVYESTTAWPQPVSQGVDAETTVVSPGTESQAPPPPDPMTALNARSTSSKKVMILDAPTIMTSPRRPLDSDHLPSNGSDTVDTPTQDVSAIPSSTSGAQRSILPNLDDMHAGFTSADLPMRSMAYGSSSSRQRQTNTALEVDTALEEDDDPRAPLSTRASSMPSRRTGRQSELMSDEEDPDGNEDARRTLIYNDDAESSITLEIEKVKREPHWGRTDSGKFNFRQGVELLGACNPTLVNHIAVSPLNPGLVACANVPPQCASVWDYRTPYPGAKVSAPNLPRHARPVLAVAFSPFHEHVLATGSIDETVLVVDYKTGFQLASLDGLAGKITSIAFSPFDPNLLFAATHERYIKVWNWLTASEVDTIRISTKDLRCIAASPHDPAIVAVCGADSYLRLYNWQTGAVVQRFDHPNECLQVVFCPYDSNLIAVASGDRCGRVFNVATGQESLLLKGHVSYVVSVTWSPHLKLVATGSLDMTCKVWDAVSGYNLYTLNIYASVRSVAFSPVTPRVLVVAGDVTDIGLARLEARFRGLESGLAEADLDGIPDELLPVTDTQLAVRAFNLTTAV